MDFDYPTSEVTSPITSNVNVPLEVKQPSILVDNKKQFIILTSLCSVIGLLAIIAFILSILAFLHQPQSLFSPEQISNLEAISENVSISNSNVVASGFEDTEVFSAIGDVLKCNLATVGNIVCGTLTTNDLKTSSFVAPILQINELKTTSIQLNGSESNSVFTPDSIVYSNTDSNTTNTFEAGSLVLLDNATNDSTEITANQIIFHLNSGKIKNLESLRFMGLNLSQSTVFNPGVATLLLPTSGGQQFGSLTIPPTDLKVGSTFRITAYGTFIVQNGSANAFTFTIANTQNKVSNQPSQIIIGYYPTHFTLGGNTSGKWVFTSTFSINSINDASLTSFQSFGNVTANSANELVDVMLNYNSANINIQQGLQLSVWASWESAIGAQLTLNKIFLEQLL